jgi:hypothetical protein
MAALYHPVSWPIRRLPEHRNGSGRLSGRVRLRDYRPSDLPAVLAVDQRAFVGPWLYSRSVLAAALDQAASVTVLEAEGVVAGYQLSTASALKRTQRLAWIRSFRARATIEALVRGLVYEFGLRLRPGLGQHSPIMPV